MTASVPSRCPRGGTDASHNFLFGGYCARLIENAQHWVLDVVFQEDQCRARLDNAAENLALLRRLAMNLMAKEGTKHASLRVKGRTAGWDDDLMAQILTAGTT